MARKRLNDAESMVSASAAPAREKPKSTHTSHTVSSRAETFPAIPPSPAPVLAEPAPSTTELKPITTERTPNHSVAPNDQEIASLAYSYWETRGRQGGSAAEDWARAESELRAGSKS